MGPAGRAVDVGETPIVAAEREAREEVGLDVQVEALVGMYLLRGGGWPDVLVHVFLVRSEQGTPSVVNSNEVERVEWRTLTELPSPLLPDARVALEDWSCSKRGVVRTVTRQVDFPAWEAG
ncbi:NUDIX hydrolase [Deinococcus peraridilitoris]|uniref:ADP-ribose pyrophosphatase n=1 Tax=Deinococcus peraridilitoris (strain DSM 19664 / LMG 22246 / CIP 109416 / KR-200) TaxID=937777 RepID=K9ZYG6_DEIPD|nr:NUDIX hydrolase [Deinococcus peraridilitoris]AFZ66611.1 ADP-ribose pyrophosphatase [Deinococcus peraridilitoris DSM 19664]